MIKGGFYIKARAIQDSDIAHASPCTREIWDYLLREASYEDTKITKRGQLIRTLSGIREALSWFVGYRKMSYSLDQCEAATKWLRSREMITTTKTTRGMIITVCNYDTYQTIRNYENGTDTVANTAITPEYTGTINKNRRIKEGKKIGADAPPPTPVLTLITEVDAIYNLFQEWLAKNAPRVLKMKNPITMEQYAQLRKEFNNPALKKLLTDTLLAMENWKDLNKNLHAFATVRKWASREIKQNPSFYETKTDELGKLEQRSSREKQGEAFLSGIN